MAMTPTEVEVICFKGILENFLNEGTIIKPPPTPSKPDIIPVIPPVNIREAAHFLVQ